MIGISPSPPLLQALREVRALLLGGCPLLPLLFRGPPPPLSPAGSAQGERVADWGVPYFFLPGRRVLPPPSPVVHVQGASVSDRGVSPPSSVPWIRGSSPDNVKFSYSILSSQIFLTI